MQRTLIVIVGSATLLGFFYWLKQSFGLEAAIVIPGLIGTAAALAALVEAKKHARKPHFTVSEAWFSFKGEVFRGYELGASLINEGDQHDVLRSVDHQLYRRDLGFIDSVLICGGREISMKIGHVLPIECRPRILYRVDGVAFIPVAAARMYRATGSFGVDDYVLRCRFVFAGAKPVTVRVTQMGLSLKSPILHAIGEFLLRLRTRNKNPFG